MIIIKNAHTHNLQQVDLEVPLGKFVAFTGVSGSGKSSLAFDTLYVEGQRRYLLSLSGSSSTQALQLPHVDVEEITSLPPTIAIQQKAANHNPRSTVGTLTNVYDYMRVLFARLGIAYCPITGERVTPTSRAQISETILSYPKGSALTFLSPYAVNKKGTFVRDFEELLQKGFLRVRVDGTVYALDDAMPKLNKNSPHDVDIVMDRIKLDEHASNRVNEAISSCLDLGKGQMKLLVGDEEVLFSESAYSKKADVYYPPLEPHNFSFNHPLGMCQTCEGLGYVESFDLEQLIDPNKSLSEDVLVMTGSYSTIKWKNIYDNLARIYEFSVTTPWKDLPDKAKKVLLHGTRKKWTTLYCTHPYSGRKWVDYVQWKGALHEGKKRKSRHWMTRAVCPDCQGARLQAYPAAVKFKGKTLFSLVQMSLEDLRAFFTRLTLNKEEQALGQDLIAEISNRLDFICRIGLSYLTLDRIVPTLSGGETQRLRLTAHLGGGLVGALYILDEPSIGLHPSDQAQLIQAIYTLRDRGNSVIVVEHDEATIRAADFIVDIGPGAGVRGGQIVSTGTPKEIAACKESITGDFLSGRRVMPYPKQRRPIGDQILQLSGAKLHNLKDVTLDIPLGLFVGICGVSGSGKSSLIMETLYPAVANAVDKTSLTTGPFKALSGQEAVGKVIAIDQSPIGRTPRSNPVTYTKIFDQIRDLFSSLPESLAHGYDKGRFSFNTPEGCCVRCKGYGMNKVDMDFLEDEWVICPNCQGKRFDEKTLEVTYREKNIYDVLNLTVEEACTFFENLPPIQKKLEVMLSVGLGYMKLGQSATTLSGGEAQRIKLCKELIRPSHGHTLYILDEPTTGLHLHDIEKLLVLIQGLVDQGNTVVMIEHNTECLRCTDHIIDMGPGGGAAGGQIVKAGSVEDVSKSKSPTARYLRDADTEETPKDTKKSAQTKDIVVTGARQNTLQDVSLTIRRNEISFFIGPSGSGKSSLAFETLYAEGQRRFAETLPPYVRQQIGPKIRPNVDDIKGLPPTIALEQVFSQHNRRSTLGTMTEIYDYLRVLYATIGQAFVPGSDQPITHITPEYVTKRLLKEPEGTKLHILSPIDIKQTTSADWLTKGYLRARVDGSYEELDNPNLWDKQHSQTVELVVDRLVVKPEVRQRLFEAVVTAKDLGKNTLIAATDKKDLFFNMAFADPKTGVSYPSITPQSFSFNTEHGMCQTCEGWGVCWGSTLVHNKELRAYTAYELCAFLFHEPEFSAMQSLILDALEQNNIATDVPIEEMSAKEKKLLFKGSKEMIRKAGLSFQWKGLDVLLEELARHGYPEVKEALRPHMKESICPDCQGERLNPLSRNVRIDNVSLGTLFKEPIASVLSFLRKLEPQDKTRHILSALITKTSLLCDMGLDYLSLGRSASSLSGGELQRTRISQQLSNGLTGSLYVLDEPTIGLHPQNNEQMNSVLQGLCHQGNTLVIVEHDPLTLPIGDYFYDFGPHSGIHGGHVVAQGTLKEISKNTNSPTGTYLSGRKKLPYPSQRKEATEHIQITHAKKHNITDLSANIPLGVLVGVCGVSGAGKSTLVHDILQPVLEDNCALKTPKKQVTLQSTKFENLDKIHNVLALKQTFSKVTSRSDVITYLEILTPLRQFFAKLPQAAAAGLLPRQFSYNHKAGMCKTCQGLGVQTIELQYLPPVEKPCSACSGYRLNPLSLSVHYKGKNMGQILQLNVEEAKEFLPHLPKLHKTLDSLIEVGLGYLSLGQPIGTLSGGETNRIRLSRELIKRNTSKRTLYILDEPTTGLHFDDLAIILPLLRKLTDKGHSVLMIEHNTDALAFCDYLIELGPGPGDKGGTITAAAPYDKFSKNRHSVTAKYLI